MEKNDSGNKGREASAKDEGRPDNKDRDNRPTRDRNYVPFAKDKRQRITRVEKTERRPRQEGEQRDDRPRKPFDGDRPRKPYDGERRDSRPQRSSDNDKPHRTYNDDRPRKPFDGDRPRKPYDGERRDDQAKKEWRKPFSGGNERHSYNPNFTSDNRLRDESKRSDDRDNRGGGFRDRKYDDRNRGGNRDYNRDQNRPARSTSLQEELSRDDSGFNSTRPPRRDGGAPSRKPYDKPYGKPGDKPYGRSGGGKPYGKSGDRPFNKSYGKPAKSARPKASKSNVHGEYSDGTYPVFTPAPVTVEMRLNRHIAASGKCSRRDADELIRTGRVTVNGSVVVEMGSKVMPGDNVEVDGARVDSEKKVYILMNKPKGFVTTLEDPHADKTVMDLLSNIVHERVYPVGRLDKNSLGVLLITNDGDLTSRLTHPSYNKKKIYQVTLDRPLTKADMERIAEGITLEDGDIRADAIDYVAESRKEVGLEIHSGRNRIVRRIFELLGYKVSKLDRVYFAGLTKRNLKRGQWRFLSPTEVDILHSGLYE